MAWRLSSVFVAVWAQGWPGDCQAFLAWRLAKIFVAAWAWGWPGGWQRFLLRVGLRDGLAAGKGFCCGLGLGMAWRLANVLVAVWGLAAGKRFRCDLGLGMAGQLASVFARFGLGGGFGGWQAFSLRFGLGDALAAGKCFHCGLGSGMAGRLAFGAGLLPAELWVRSGGWRGSTRAKWQSGALRGALWSRVFLAATDSTLATEKSGGGRCGPGAAVRTDGQIWRR